MIITTCLPSILQWTLNIEHHSFAFYIAVLNNERQTSSTKHWTLNITCLSSWPPAPAFLWSPTSIRHPSEHRCLRLRRCHVHDTRDEDYRWKTNSAGAPWPLLTAIIGSGILKPVLLLLLLLISTGLIIVCGQCKHWLSNIHTLYFIGAI